MISNLLNNTIFNRAENSKDDDVEDRDRERHVLLCRVIRIAKVNVKVNVNSTESLQPSEDVSCDSDVDMEDEESKHGIIWTNDMNTRVIPECIVNFKYESKSKSKSKSTSLVNNCLSFSQLFAEIETSLSPTAKRILDMLFNRYKVIS